MPAAEVKICNQKGLHARAAAKFVKLAARFDSQIWVERGDQRVSGRSIMGLMMLAAGPGCAIFISADGPDQKTALAALSALVERGFDEQD